MAEWLAQHGVEAAIASAVAEVLRQDPRPADPVKSIAEILLASKAAAPPAPVDPRGLVDATPDLQVDPTTSQLALKLAAGDLAKNLTELNLKKAGIKALPPAVAGLEQLVKLDISLSPLSELPSELSKLSKLRIFFVLGCRFTSIPLVVGTLPSLYMLSFKSNQLTVIDDGALAPTIEWLILTDNQLAALPSKLPAGLKKLMLTNNKLEALPDAICGCRELELIRLADNRLTALPEGFLALPMLAWCGLAGNPLVARAANTLPATTWVPHSELVIGEQLGAGGGGFVHRAIWSRQPSDAVAVKLFRGAGTVTDGDPAHEIDLGSALGHPNVIRVHGATPAPKLGLVLELLDVKTTWSELGLPPNFDTCARDTYPPAKTFAAASALRTLSGVAAACRHLHAKGFTHGDLYAHNTLVDTRGEAKVGDFGAAYNYEPLGAAAAVNIERVEVRAFGAMAEELAERLDPQDEASVRLKPALDLLTARCMSPDVAARPSFAEIVDRLTSAGVECGLASRL